MITGGGTGGHVFPALAMAAELKKRGLEVIYVGTARGLESKLAPQAGLRFVTLQSGPIKNQKLTVIAQTIYKLLRSVGWSILFLRREKVRAVIGVGGYVSAPMCLAAFVLRKPLFLQEQNVSVGIANRLLGRMANQVFLGFSQAVRYFPRRKCLVTGNPVRSEFFTQSFPLPSESCLLVFGGSQGAAVINNAIAHLLPKLRQKMPRLFIIHQTGEKDKERIEEEYRKHWEKGRYEVHAFITEMAQAFRRSSFVVCRSGALTVSELIQVQRPAVLIPFPRKGQNDQTANAYFLEETGVAKVVEQGESFEERLWNALDSTFEPACLERMRSRYAELPRRDPLVAIGDHVVERI